MKPVHAHTLAPLLQPASIAVVGASEKEGSVGRRTVENLLRGGYAGRLYAVNPGYGSVRGVPCFPALEALPETVEHVVLTLGDANIEGGLDAAIAHGARAATMMSSLELRDDSEPRLRDRVARKIAESGLIVCGANGMGFYNFADGVWVCGFDTRDNHPRGGNVTLISHSGSGMSGIIDCEERIDFNLAVSTGQELSVTMDQYMDWALDRPETRAIGLFMETARNPQGMIAAFAKASRLGVPVVVLKVGCTELSARLAVSHSGAIAGRDDAYQALFDRHGVQRVRDMDELATTLMVFAQPHPVAAGGLVSIHDSGGERQLLIDLAEDVGVPLAEIEPATVGRLEELLDPGLPAVNPLDAWGAGGPGAGGIVRDSLAALMADPNAALGAVVHDRAPHGALYGEYFDYLRAGHLASGKPAFLVSNRQGSGSDPAAVRITREGFPVIDGLRSFLVGVRCLLDYRDFRARPAAQVAGADPETVAKWRARLAAGESLDEYESGRLLRDFGVPVNPARRVSGPAELREAAAGLGFPLVLKTAVAGILHKTERGGVRLAIENAQQLERAYADLAGRLGPDALVAPMVDSRGVEMLLGMVRDEQFGPLVTLGFGGVRVEVIRDVACALPPFDRAAARRLLDSLRLRPLLEGVRGGPAADVEAFCIAAERFSVLAHALGDAIDEIDVNPVIVHADGCVAVDGLVVGRRQGAGSGIVSEIRT
ncbi:MAG: acetate--CoA ligase family protein [Xanthomonadales bacterium]|jgi:acyl-CoA synthetase (NDP forming)|nr:acetate--CoA ligase family protein [Xanthomonadales bacterium]